MARIHGILNNASGVRPNTKIVLEAAKTTNDVVIYAPDQAITTDASGAYDFECKPSFYNVTIIQQGFPREKVGIIQVYSDSVDGSLNEFLTTFKPDDLTPQILKDCLAARDAAISAADRAEQAADTAAEETAQKVGLMFPVNSGNWSTVAGTQLTEVDRYKAWDYPDNSADRYAVRGNVTLPITIPVAPDSNWYLASAVNVEKMRSEAASQLGLVYDGEWVSGITIPTDAMKDKLAYWYNEQFYSVGTDTSFTSINFDTDLADGRFLSQLTQTIDFTPTVNAITRTIRSRLEDFVHFNDYLTPQQIADSQNPDPDYIPSYGIDEQLRKAISDLGGTKDIGTAYIYAPTKTLFVNSGVYGLELVNDAIIDLAKNNIRIIGEGTFNTRFLKIGSNNCQRMFRLFEAYSCEISYLTIDCGLPFTPNGTETNGADIGLQIDQAAHFVSHGLNICNYRIRGMQVSHLWESYFSDLRIFNGGFFGTQSVPSAHIDWSDYLSTSTAFPGHESNNITFAGKTAFGGIGSYSRGIAPMFNVWFENVIAEGRTYSKKLGSMSATKWIVSSSSRNVIVNKGYTYAHEQPFECNAALIDVSNCQHDIKFINYDVYQELTLPGHHLEITKLFGNSSSYPVEIDLSLEDRGTARTEWGFANPATLITGNFNYRSEQDRDLDDMMNASAKKFFSGQVTWIDGSFELDEPKIYRFKGKAETLSAIDGDGIYEEYACRAFGLINMTSGQITDKNLTLTKTATGNLNATFTNPMPDTSYTIDVSSPGITSWDLANKTQSGFQLSISNAIGAFDSDHVSVTIFR